MYCQECSAKNSPKDNYCIECGVIFSEFDKNRNSDKFDLPRGIKKVNFYLFLIPNISFVLLIITSFIINPGMIEDINIDSKNSVIGLCFLNAGFAASIFAYVYQLIIVYNAWKLLEYRRLDITPGKAVGFLFIPFFNLYWIFKVYRDWAEHINSSIMEKNLSIKSVNETLFKTYPLLILINTILSAIPIINIIAGLLSITIYVITFVILYSMCNTINTYIMNYKKQ